MVSLYKKHSKISNKTYFGVGASLSTLSLGVCKETRLCIYTDVVLTPQIDTSIFLTT